MKPRVSITDPTFKYRDSASTDLRKTFARVRRELAAAAKQPTAVVTTIKPGAKHAHR